MSRSLSKKIRFEVFKRDSFTCQYCGRSAPAVVLQVDHIDPVSAGGGNEILNLLTSCVECNSGKSDRKISDDAVVRRQLDQLTELQCRREQIEMLLEWRKGLESIQEDVEDHVAALFSDKTGYELTRTELNQLSRKIKKLGLVEVLAVIEDCCAYHIKYDGSAVLEESVATTVRAIFGRLVILERSESDPHLRTVRYTIGILRNHHRSINKGVAEHCIRAALTAGFSSDEIQRIAASSRNWWTWLDEMNQLIEGAD